MPILLPYYLLFSGLVTEQLLIVPLVRDHGNAPEVLMFKNNYLLPYSERTFCLGIKLLPHTFMEGSEDNSIIF